MSEKVSKCQLIHNSKCGWFVALTSNPCRTTAVWLTRVCPLMHRLATLEPQLRAQLVKAEPTVWINPKQGSSALDELRLTAADLQEPAVEASKDHDMIYVTLKFEDVVQNFSPIALIACHDPNRPLPQLMTSLYHMYQKFSRCDGNVLK
eukprot:2995894-Amphidinium_carterae.1